MEIVFKAKDGTLFVSVKECVEYERRMAGVPRRWKGWDWQGNPTNDTSDALMVYFCDDEASVQFIADAKLNADDDVDGFEEGESGWYYWDEDEGIYRFLDYPFINIIRNASVS